MRSRMLVASALALFLGSCDRLDAGGCGPSADLVTGTYRSAGNGRWTGARGAFPHDNGQPKTLRLEREAGFLRITYLRDGQEVVETWRPRPGDDFWPTDASVGDARAD